MLAGAFVALAVLATAAWFGRGHAAVVRHTDPAPNPPDWSKIPIPVPLDDSDYPPAPVRHASGHTSQPQLPEPYAKPDPLQPARPNPSMPMIRPDGPIVTITPEMPGKAGDGGPSNGVYSLGQLDEGPVAVYQARPIYPNLLKDSGTTGDVVVSFVVDTDGSVRNAVAVRSSNPAFEEPAVRAVSQWKFRPGRRLGVAVRTRTQVSVVFSLDN